LDLYRVHPSSCPGTKEPSHGLSDRIASVANFPADLQSAAADAGRRGRVGSRSVRPACTSRRSRARRSRSPRTTGTRLARRYRSLAVAGRPGPARARRLAACATTRPVRSQARHTHRRSPSIAPGDQPPACRPPALEQPSASRTWRPSQRWIVRLTSARCVGPRRATTSRATVWSPR
jgi:hypothetical protein